MILQNNAYFVSHIFWRAAREARDENVPAKRADFFNIKNQSIKYTSFREIS